MTNGHACNVYLGDRVYADRITPLHQWYMEKFGVAINIVNDLSKHLHDGADKMMVIDEPKKISSIRTVISNKHSNLSITGSQSIYLEMMGPGVSKGKALKYLASNLGVPKEKVMAIGDSYNDLEMLKWAGISVAMENSTKAVKEIAKYVTKSNDDDGVAHAMHRWALKSIECDV